MTFNKIDSRWPPGGGLHTVSVFANYYYQAYYLFLLTIQKSVSLAKSTYWSMVERTLKMRQINTAIKLHKQTTPTIFDQYQSINRSPINCSSISRNRYPVKSHYLNKKNINACSATNMLDFSGNYCRI